MQNKRSIKLKFFQQEKMRTISNLSLFKYSAYCLNFSLRCRNSSLPVFTRKTKKWPIRCRADYFDAIACWIQNFIILFRFSVEGMSIKQEASSWHPHESTLNLMQLGDLLVAVGNAADSTVEFRVPNRDRHRAGFCPGRKIWNTGRALNRFVCLRGTYLYLIINRKKWNNIPL